MNGPAASIVFTYHNPLEVMTPKGAGLLIAFIDYGIHCNPVYHVRLHETGQPLNFDSADCRIEGNEMWRIPEPPGLLGVSVEEASEHKAKGLK